MTVARRRSARGRGEELRNDILAATQELLTRVGSADDVSIRAIAKAVGVTPPSVYLHFADKDALIQEVCSRVFDDLDVSIQAACSPDDSPLERVRSQGLAYVRFALAHPEQYRVATMVHSSTPGVVDIAMSSAVFTHFVAAIEDCIAEGLFADRGATNIALSLWSAAHGIAGLMITKAYLPWGDADDAAERAMRNACIGEAVAGLFESGPTPAQVTAWLREQPKVPTA